MVNSHDIWTPSTHAHDIATWKHRRKYLAAMIAAGASIATIVVIVTVIGFSPGWHRTRDSFFSWEYASLAAPVIFHGILINIKLMVICSVLAFILGLILALIRISKNPALFPLRMIATIYVDIFRGLPVILLIYVLGFGVPSLQIPSVPTNPLVWGTTALILTYSSYISEVIRSGILSVHPAQWDAGRCLGLSYRTIVCYIVLPQALRAITPALVNDLVSLEKDTGLVAVLGVVDAIRAAGIISGEKFNYTPYIVAGIFFLILTIPLTRFTDSLLASNRHKQYGA